MLKINNDRFSQDFGRSQLCKAGKLFGGEETIFFDKTQIAASLAICFILPTFPGNDQRGRPFGIPKFIFLLS